VRAPVYIYSEYVIFIGNRRAPVTFTIDPYLVENVEELIAVCLKVRGKNDFAEGSKILLDTDLK